MTETIITIVAISAVIYASIRAAIHLRTLDRLIWTRLRLDPEGAPTQPHNGHDTFHTHILTVARRYLGIQESPKGSNRGPYIDEFIKFTGLQPPQPWCAAFVSYVIHKAADELGIPTDWPKTASTPQILRYGKQSGKLITRQEIQLGAKPQPGDVFLLYYPALNRVAHTGFVERVLPLGVITTIEGNTNDQGGREGYKVARRIRRLKSIYALVRL
jgi:hypothetical protein